MNLSALTSWHTTAACALVMVVASGCSGCGQDNNQQSPFSATVTIDSLTPPIAYADTPVEVAFTIAPGAETTAADLSWRVDFGDGEEQVGDDITTMSASHTYTFSGDFTITVAAIADGVEVAKATSEYKVLAPTELAISNALGQPANIDAGDDLSVSATITNSLAEDVITAIPLTAYLAKDPGATLDDLGDLIVLGNGALEPAADGLVTISAGSSQETSFTTRIPDDTASGDYYLVVVIDPENSIADQDRSNNLAVGASVVRVTNASQIEPDLAVTQVLAAPERAFPELNSVTRGFTLVNNGGLDLFQVVVETYISLGDDTLSDDDTLIHTSAPIDQITSRGGMATVDPETFVLDQAITPAADEELQAWVIVKAYSLDDTVESDEANNILAAPTPIVITDQLVDGPDISVVDFSVAPDRTFLDGALSYRIELANEGNVDIASFLCRVYLAEEKRINTLADQPADSINVNNLESEGTKTIEDTITISALFDPGTYYVYVICDPNDLLAEPFRSNNQFIFDSPITITDQADVDLVAETLTVPLAANEGETVTVELEACATGTNATGTTQAALYRTPGNRVDFNSDPIAMATIENINPGDCRTVEFEVATECEQFEELYAFGVIVDTLDRLPENNETNNAKIGTNPLTVAGPFCACNEDIYEPNNTPLASKLLPIGASDLALCTAGTCDFYKTPEILEGDSIVVTNTHDPDRGVLVTRLFDSTGVTALDIDRSASGKQDVALFLATGGEYVVEVCGTDIQTRNLYELDIEVLAQSPTVDIVPREVSLPTRDSFSIGARVDLTYDLLNLGQQDAPGFPVEIRISPDQTIDANDLLVTTQNIDELLATAQTDQTVQITIPTALVDGEYYIGVTVDPANITGDSNITNNTAITEKLTIATGCYDPLEPNDSFQDAYPIDQSGTFSNLISCTSAADYYRICADDAKKITVTTTFNAMMGDIDLELFDDKLDKIASATNGADTEQVAVPYVNGAQCYYARVVLTPTPGAMMMQESLYALDVQIEDVDPSLRCDAYAEPNDSFDTATALASAASAQSIDRCPSTDTDYFYFDVAAPGQLFTITATKTPAQQAGTLRLQLYNPNQIPGINEETAPDQPTATISNFLAPAAGRYWVQVTVSGAERNVSYELDFQGTTGVDLVPEDLVIGPGTYKPGDTLRIGFNLYNRGNEATLAAPNFQLALGTSTTPDPMNDTPLGMTGMFQATAPLTSNAFEDIFIQTEVPLGLPPGNYFVHVVVEDTDDIRPLNNFTSVPVTVVP